MSRKPHKIGECVYCGRIGKLTIDHIPPKLLFGSPLPENLIKVLSCEQCHGQNPQVSRDDEYFRVMLTLREDIDNHPVVKQILPTVYRSLAKPKSKGLIKSLLKTMRDVELKTPSGLYLGRRTSYNVKIARLDNVAKRILKGLFWHETGHRIPDEYNAVAFYDGGLEKLEDDVKQQIDTRIIPLLATVTPKIIGNRVFSYRVLFLPDDANTSIWLFIFYERIGFLCATHPSDLIT